MASEFTITRRVEFSETDLAGIMHFTNFYRWMEICEQAEFLRSWAFRSTWRTRMAALVGPVSKRLAASKDHCVSKK